MKISCIGIGSMGSAIMSAICKKYTSKDITVSAKNFDHAKDFAKNNNCNSAPTNKNAVLNAKYIFLAVKPVFVESVLKEIKDSIQKDSVIISMAAGVSLEKLKNIVNAKFIRIMPNMPAQIAQGMTALCCNSDISENELNDVIQLLETTGKVEKIDEKLMDCVTAISGSGPAYVFMFIEALADAAVRFGMPRSQAYIYAAQTVKGSASMVLETKKHPAVLKDAVCSPGGTTIEGVAALEENGFRNAIIEAATAAFKKSANLGK